MKNTDIKLNTDVLQQELALVLWIDTYGHVGEKTKESWKEYSSANNFIVGFIVNEDEHDIQIAGDYFYKQEPMVSEGTFRSVTSIPKSTILWVKKIPIGNLYKA